MPTTSPGPTSTPASQRIVFERGWLVCYRIFDVAEEINLQSASRLMSAAKRTRLSREGSEYLQMPNPPLALVLGKTTVRLRHSEKTADVWARVYDHGAVSIILRVPVAPGTELESLVPEADELYDSAEVDRITREFVETLRTQLEPSVEGPHLWDQSESYTVVFAESLRGEPTAKELLAAPGLVRLLLGESGARPLSEREVADVLHHNFSYTDQDLVVVDWNAAFVYEPSGSQDVLDILEIANAQLLELRYYDDKLDGLLGSAHVKMQERTKHGSLNLFVSPYRALARQVLLSVIELSEFVERVENSLKIIGDFYLAKVYEASVAQLRIPQWQASVTRKQQLLEQTYQLLKGEVDTDRALTLELAIVVLIVSEIVLALASVLPI